MVACDGHVESDLRVRRGKETFFLEECCLSSGLDTSYRNIHSCLLIAISTLKITWWRSNCFISLFSSLYPFVISGIIRPFGSSLESGYQDINIRCVGN